MEKKISVQICSYNRKHLLEKVVHSLFDQTLDKQLYELVIVDDGSTDGTDEMVQGIASPVDLIFIRQNKEGLAAGRNKAILQAKGKIILFIDDDVMADPHLLKEHVTAHEEYPRSVIKGWVNHVLTLERPRKPKWTMKDFSTAFFWTSNVSVEKENLIKAGLFDEDFKEYGWEDLELGLRLKKLGLKSRINPKAIGFHYKRNPVGSDVQSMLSQAEAKARTALLFVQKTKSWRARLATGIYPARLAFDRVFSNRHFTKLCEHFLAKNGEAKPLSRFEQFCARSLTTARYFEAIRTQLKNESLF